ncbi:hypothetical protein [Candidatus Magnetaquicoccus inordinatus]|uniref:hypothetical protein n=1 Tax=Candidatus Magnetaquicoccus inordinatus TaxID=2496818 RepID=UPI00102AC9A8|nr:hypothetical protein [Candidatus Magnetaquicoccus inordinatus]
MGEKHVSVTARARKNYSTSAVIVIFGIFLVLLSGCHPWMRAEAYIGDDGALYFTIPNREKYNSVSIYSFYIYQLQDEKPKPDGEYWSFSKSGSPKKIQFGECNDFPLRYGEELPEMDIELQPKKIINGEYALRGVVRITDDKNWHTLQMHGKFIYNNGFVKNIN